MTDLRVLAFGDDNRPYHKFGEFGPVLESFLEERGIGVDLTSDRTTFESGLDAYDAVVSYHPSPRTSEWALTDAQLDGIESFVRAGNGYVALHAAAALLEDDPLHQRQAELLGGRLLGHPDTMDVRVQVEAPDHPVMDGVASFEAHEEPYEMEPYGDVSILATLECEAFETASCWVRAEGDGRVCYCSLGHTEEVWNHPSFRGIVTNAVRWTAG